MSPRPPRRLAWLFAGAALAAAGCRDDMRNQPRYEPLEGSALFEDGRASRPLVPGAVARGQLHDDALLWTGKEDGVLATRFPFPVTRAVLDRGRERYNIFCAPCHDATGAGYGMVVRRGLRRPPSFHIPRLREAADGYYFDVMTNGFGAMQSYARMVPARDRWAIVAYLRALQLSQDAPLSDATEDARARLAAGEEVVPDGGKAADAHGSAPRGGTGHTPKARGGDAHGAGGDH